MGTSSLGILVIVAALVIGVAIVAFLVGLPISGRSFAGPSWRQNMKSMVAAQRASANQSNLTGLKQESTTTVAETLAREGDVQRVAEGKLTLRKKLKYAHWNNFPPFLFSLSQILISLVVFLIVRRFLDTPIQAISLLSGPMIMNWLLTNRINSRFNKFDADFPQFLLSLVGLLKTGLNPLQALEASAEGLDINSSVRMEVQLMLERLRLGVPEERSIGSFGEDIYHQEIELFVQALILSRRLGGNLSDTLDRLSRQVRKRQYFRKSANAAVGLQRGSIWFILCILIGLQVYLFFAWPETIITTWTDTKGRAVGQTGLIVIMLGLFWVRQVTKIRV